MYISAHFRLFLMIVLNLVLTISSVPGRHVFPVSPLNQAQPKGFTKETTFGQNRNIGEKEFILSIDSTLWARWGFRYPVTYLFEYRDTGVVEVSRRDSGTDPWQILPAKTGTDYFNGIETFRVDSAKKCISVSVGFQKSPTIYLKFRSRGTIAYEGPSRYYDNRKATYTLSLDNWGCNTRPGANAGIPCASMTDDGGDKYQAAIWACRHFRIPPSVAINTKMVSMTDVWPVVQSEIDSAGVEPAVHSGTHPCNDASYLKNGYKTEILGCRDDIVSNLKNIPYGNNRIFEFIIPCGFENEDIYETSKNEFLFLRRWSGSDNPADTVFASWDSIYHYYRGGLETKSYDVVFEARTTKGRYYAADVEKLNSAFEAVYNRGGIFYAMWHPDRYKNSVIYDTKAPQEGTQGSSLMQHLAYVSGRTDVWYVANGWLYSYHTAAENVECFCQLTVTAGAAGTITTPSSSPILVKHGRATAIAASADTGYHFVKWTVTGGYAAIADTNASSTTVTLTCGNATLNAIFASHTNRVVLSSASHGTVRPEGVQNVKYGDTLNDTAVAYAGYCFDSWSIAGGVTVVEEDSTGRFRITGDGTIQANFKVKRYSMTCTATNGSVKKEPDLPLYDSGSVVTLMAIPTIGYHFSGWSGDLTGSANPCSLVIKKNTT
ncbi:MAG: hypothetical protein JW795_08530, partial [Chitinivibrionales bacterium]|nr:hypothetical protein [Chitinivibrionales bacterium]